MGAENRASPPRPRRAIVFNADDLGLTPGVTAGIARAREAGLVRSASLLVTTPGFDGAVAVARRLGTLDLGAHLALTGTPPLLPPARIPSLVTRDGAFPPLPRWLLRAATGRLRRDELRAELRAQLARARDTGLSFTHLDSHHHTHLHRAVAPVVAELAREFDIGIIRRVRSVADGAPLAARGRSARGGSRRTGRATDVGGVAGRAWPRRLVLEGLDRRSAACFASFARTSAFRGVAFPTSIRAWHDLIATLPSGLTEFMCHPGARDDGIRAYDGYIGGRETELRWLADPRVAALLADAAVEVTSFAGWFAAPAGSDSGETAALTRNSPLALPAGAGR